MIRRVALGFVAVWLLAGAAAAQSWYDNYDAGIAAIRKGQWQTAVQKMSAAIKDKSQENDKLRAYGTLFYNYHPYYYRGVAYLNLGQYEKAVSDLEQATGVGEENLGSIDTLMQRAKTKLAQASAPEPQPAAPQPQPAAPQPQPARPAVVTPAAPAISPAMRQQAAAQIRDAEQAQARAQARKAGSAPVFVQAMQQLADARQKSATAKSDDDLNAAIASANNAKMFFDSAQSATAAAAPPRIVPQPPSKATTATKATIGPTSSRVRTALEAYFRGDFEQAAEGFAQLAQELPKNGWIYAFLGASQYSLYAFELDDNYKAKAMESFKKAKQLRFRDGELPPKYFSKRIRKVFKKTTG